jgi:hypothetical protein
MIRLGEGTRSFNGGAIRCRKSRMTLPDRETTSDPASYEEEMEGGFPLAEPLCSGERMALAATHVRADGAWRVGPQHGPLRTGPSRSTLKHVRKIASRMQGGETQASSRRATRGCWARIPREWLLRVPHEA